MNLGLLGSDFDFDFKDAGVFLGVNGFYSFSDKLKTEGALRLNLLNLSGGGFSIQTEAGALYILKTSTQKKDVPVILSTTLRAGTDSNENSYDQTNLININGTYKNQYGVRGGLYFKSSTLNTVDASQLDIAGSYSSIVIYAGFEKISHVFVNALVNGRNNYGQGRTRIYAGEVLYAGKSIDIAGYNIDDENQLAIELVFNDNRNLLKEIGLNLFIQQKLVQDLLQVSIS